MNYLFKTLNNISAKLLQFPSTKTIRLCSTVVSSQSKSVSPVTGEPDKLYGTIELEMRGHDPAVLKSYAWFLTHAAQLLHINVGKNFALRKSQKERHTLLKSVHIYKKHRVQYEFRTYFHFLHLHRLTGSTADTYLEYIERNLPEGVALKVTKVELQELPEHIISPKQVGDETR